METINFILKKSMEADSQQIVKHLTFIGAKNIQRAASTFSGLLEIKRGKPENILKGLVDKDIGVIQVTGLTTGAGRDKDFFYPPKIKSEIVHSFKYGDYFGSIGFCVDSHCFYGQVLGINPLINYQADTVEWLESEFINSVDFYINGCKKTGLKPEISLKITGNLKVITYKD